MAERVLRDQIFGIAPVNSRGQKFVPFSDVANILTYDTILNILRQNLSIPPYTRHEYARTIMKNS